MRYKIIVLLAMLWAAWCNAETFQAFIARVEAAAPAQQQLLADSFYTAHPRLPFCETDTTAHFIYRGSAVSVHLAGDATEWSPAQAPLRRIGSTTLWFLSATYEADARLDYKFVINGTSWILDPRNPHTCTGGYGPNSELRMPRYEPTQGTVYNPAIPHGAIRDTLITSTILNNARHIRIYTPPDYEQTADDYPVVLFHDGLQYLSLGSANHILDHLIAEQRIPALIAVFVPPINDAERAAEYAGARSALFTGFIADEVMGYIDRRYRTRKDPQSRGMVGASNGGNIALLTGFTRPEVFGLIAAHSSNVESSLFDAWQAAGKKSLRLYLDLGTYDLAVLRQRVGRFIPLLAEKGYDYHYQEVAEGHSWGNWKGHLDDALTFLFPMETQGVAPQEGQPQSFHLGQNYPNPFNPHTTIPFVLHEAMEIRLTVHDLLGRTAAVLFSGRRAAGAYQMPFAADALPGGLYWCRLTGAKSSQSISMLLLR